MKEVRVCELPLVEVTSDVGLNIRFKAKILEILPYLEGSDFAQVLVDDEIESFYVQVLVGEESGFTLSELVELKNQEVYFQGYLMEQDKTRNVFACIEA